MRNRIFPLLFSVSLLISVLFSPQSVYAATFQSGDTVTITKPFTDLYASGGTITVSAPIQNDLTVAGGTINLNSPISGGLLAAGGTINSKAQISNTMRAAGGTITISAPVKRDVILFGGTITLDETASVSGDVVINGGTINIQAPITGNVIVNGGQVTINSPVGGNIKAETDTLILGSKAVIDGSLDYSADSRAILRDGAILKGPENFHQKEKRNDEREKIAGLITSWSLYKLVTDILGSLALIYLLYRYTKRVVEAGDTEPLKKGLLGLAGLLLGPLVGFMLLVLIVPGIITFLLYSLLLLLAAFISKLLLGKLLLRWWFARNNKSYTLDWKAAVVGPIGMFILLYIPVIGWFIGFLFFLLAIGSLLAEAGSWITGPEKKAALRKTDSPAASRNSRQGTTRKKRS